MAKRVVLGALVGAWMVVGTGCSDECVDRIDCRNSKGEPGEGKEWMCVDNTCEARSSTPPSEEDTDAGTQVDAGTQTDDAGTDAGTQTDAGVMPVAEGGVCTASADCMAGLFCETTGGSRTCQPLQIALTAEAASGGTTEAVVVRYKNPGSEPPTGTTSATKLSESTSGRSRFPRWSRDGTAVAFVEEDTSKAVTLVARNLPLTAGQTTTLTTGANAGNTLDFRYMEWAPSAQIAWCTTTSSGGRDVVSGIKVIPGSGGAVQDATFSGVFPSWAADGNSFAYSVNTLGLRTKVLGGAENPVAGAPASSEQPLHNEANGVLLYLDAGGKTETIGGVSTPLTELFTLNPADTGTPAPRPIASVTSTDVTSPAGQLKSYIANHTWAPGGTHVAYVRVFYFKPTSGGATLCAGGDNCGGRQANVIFVRRIDASGAPQGDEMELTSATLPSFSPDDHFIAYVSSRKLMVQQINPEATDAASLKVGDVITHTWSGTNVSTNRGDDHRPRWQPR